MGEIKITLPQKVNRKYQIDDADFAAELLEVLEQTAIRVKNNPARLSAEDIADIKASDKSLKDYLETGISYSWKDIKAELGL